MAFAIPPQLLMQMAPMLLSQQGGQGGLMSGLTNEKVPGQFGNEAALSPLLGSFIKGDMSRILPAALGGGFLLNGLIRGDF